MMDAIQCARKHRIREGDEEMNNMDNNIAPVLPPSNILRNNSIYRAFFIILIFIFLDQ